MLEPDQFEDDLENFPVAYEKVKAMNFNEIRADEIAKQNVYFDPYLAWDISQEHVGWVDTVSRSQGTDDFRKIVESQV